MKHPEQLFLQGIGRRLDRFLRGEAGAVTVEGVIVLPALIAVYIAGYTFFDMYRREVRIETAAYAISDALSRLDDGTLVDEDYLNGLLGLFELHTGTRQNSFLRVTLVEMLDGNLNVRPNQSLAVGNAVPHDSTSILAIAAGRIPALRPGASVLVTELSSTYTPAGFVGSGQRKVHAILVAKNRSGGTFSWPDSS
jgi:hypothetical protein